MPKEASCCHASPPPPNSLFKKILLSNWLRGIIGTLGGLILLFLPFMVGALPFATLVGIAIGSILFTLLLGAESYYKAWEELSSFKPRMHTLFALSTITVIGVSIASFFVPWLPLMLDAGLLIFGLLHIGNAIRETMKQSMKLQSRFSDEIPAQIRRKRQEDGIEEVSWEELQVGDVIYIKAGEIIPINGQALEVPFDLQIEDTICTGNPIPYKPRENATLLAGTRVVHGVLELSITRPKQSYLKQLDDEIGVANANVAPLETKADKILQYFIPAVILVALLSAVIIANVFSIALAVQCATAVLVSACPCTLGFIIPLAMRIGRKKAACYGVEYQNGESLETAEGVNAVVFDLHGTLTQGCPQVFTVITFSSAPVNVLQYCAALEAAYCREKESLDLSPHPTALSVSMYAKKEIPEVTLPAVSDLDTNYHSGVSGTIAGETYLLGDTSFLLEAHDIMVPPGITCSSDIPSNFIYLVHKNTKSIYGYIGLTDPLRPDAESTIQALRNMKKEVFICTGADEPTALSYANTLHISKKNVRAGCVGNAEHKNAKVAYIEELKTDGHKVAMVGDAANDAVALANCHFGIAIQSPRSHSSTQQQAGAIIRTPSLLPVANAFSVAYQAVRNIKQNLVISLLYNLTAMAISGGLLLAAGITLNPAIGVVFMFVQSFIILGNAFLFKQMKLPHLPKNPSPDGADRPAINFNARTKSPVAKCCCSTPRSDKVPAQSISVEAFSAGM